MRWARRALGIVVLLGSTRALAQTGASELQPPQQVQHGEATATSAIGAQVDHARRAPFAVSAKLESGVGQGSFVADDYARNPYVAWAASFLPAYYPLPKLTLSAFVKVAQEITNSDIDTERQQFLWYDVQLRARYMPGTIPLLGIQTLTEARAYLPTSLVSRYETLVVGALARVVLIRDVGPFSIGYSGSFRKNFHRYQTPAVDENSGSPPPLYARAGGAEDLRGSTVAIGSNNVSFAFSNLLFVSYGPLRDLSLTLYYGIANAFTYAHHDKDELSSPYATGGRGQRDTAYGGFEIWYRLNERLSFSAGVFTSATPKTEDNQSFRFPFYDFNSTATNLTLFYLDATVTEFLGG